MANDRRLGYRPELDGVRAVAISGVLLYHLYLAFGNGGLLGVDVFFVLSGFLITSLLIEERVAKGRICLRNFYLRRALRLLPALYVVVIGVLLLDAVLHKYLSGEVVASVLLYVGNWPAALHHIDGGPLGQAWSLGVEEQFYIVWPLVLIMLTRAKVEPKKIACTTAAGIACSWFLGFALYHGNGARVYFGTDTRAASLLIGCLGAVAVKAGWLDRVSHMVMRAATVLAAAALIALMLHAGALDVGPWTSALYDGADLAAAVLILGLVLQPESRLSALARSRPMVGVGRLSYSLYLWSLPVGHVVASVFHGPQAVSAVLQISVSFIAATASYRLVEGPFLRLKGRLSGQAPRAPGAEPTLDVRLAEGPPTVLGLEPSS